MGQQQLLLIVLSVIIVGVAVAVGVTMFQSGAIDANRQAIIGDLVNFAAKAQRHYRTPTQLGGGSQAFTGFGLSPIDTGNANGSYSVVSTYSFGSPSYAAGSDADVTGTPAAIFIVGCGKETGDDGTNPVKAVCEVQQDSIITTIEN